MLIEIDQSRANSSAQLPRKASRDTDEVGGRWNTEKFGDVADLKYGRSLSAGQRRGGAIPVCGSNGVVGYHDESLISGPGIVIGRKGTAGAVTWVDSDFWPIDTTYYVDCKQHSDLKWLYYAISSLRLENLREGPVPGLNRHSVAELAVKVPPLREQRKIAAVLSSVDDVIKKYEAVVNEVQIVKQGLMQQMLVRKDQVPHQIPSCSDASEHWEIVNLGDIATIVGGGTQDGPLGLLEREYTLGYTNRHHPAHGPYYLADSLHDHELWAGKFDCDTPSTEVALGDNPSDNRGVRDQYDTDGDQSGLSEPRTEIWGLCRVPILPRSASCKEPRPPWNG